jgi:predicted DNA-binding transcriptional regulator AlpA
MDKLLQAKDVASILNCSESHVYQLEKRGMLPCSFEWPCQQRNGKKPKRMVRWLYLDVERFLEKYKKNHIGEKDEAG